MSLVINYIRSPETYETIPDGVKFETLDGEVIDFKSLKGKPTVIHFWATWCPICRFESSNLNPLSGEENINLITIAVKSKNLRDFIEQNGLKYGVVDDSYGNLADKFNIEIFPTTLIYDSDGILRFSEVGYTTTVGLKTRLSML